MIFIEVNNAFAYSLEATEVRTPGGLLGAVPCNAWKWHPGKNRHLFFEQQCSRKPSKCACVLCPLSL